MVRGGPAALSRPRADRRGAVGGGASPRRLLVLPQAVPVRGRAAPLRAAGSGRADGAGAQAEAVRAPARAVDRTGRLAEISANGRRSRAPPGGRLTTPRTSEARQPGPAPA